MRRVDLLIYKVDRLGDWFLAEPAIMLLVEQARARGETVVVWAAEESAAVRTWRHFPVPIESFPFDPSGSWAKLKRACQVAVLVGRYEAHTVVCLRHSPEPVRDFVLESFRTARVFALSWRFLPGPLGLLPHELARHAAVLRAVGVPLADFRALLPRLAAPSATAPVAPATSADPIVTAEPAPPTDRLVLAPFSSAAIKDWPADQWASLVARLHNPVRRFEFWVAPDQRTRAQALQRHCEQAAPSAHVVVQTGRLAEVASALAEAKLVVSVDTFTAHVAIALDVPFVGLLGGGHFGDFAPWRRSARQVWLTHQLPCFNCDWRCRRERSECVQDIPLAQVLAAIHQVGLQVDSTALEARSRPT